MLIFTKMAEEEMDEKEIQVNAPFVIEHMDAHNRRMLIALLSVCITFVLTIIIFVVGYTIREKNWLDTLTRMEVTDNGVHELTDPLPDQ